ncbi:MAG: FtsW/RodA/SpoVE family cell cycle protein [Spirochaetes bacterium]|nr:FtsW/RodA/SpoVE family cell cycle protein [Spirochaetota bacterium]
MIQNIKKNEYDYSVLILIFVLVSIGSLMVYSRTLSKVFLLKHVVIIFIANILGVIIFFYKGFFSLIKKNYILIYVLNFILLLIPIIFKNSFSVNNSYRWIRIGFFSFQPSELAKLTIILVFSVIMSEKKSRVFNYDKEFLFPLILTLIYVVLIILQKDLSTAILFSMFLIVSYFIIGVPFLYIFYLLTFGTCLFVILSIYSGYRSYRLLAFFDPFRYSDDIGYQVIKSFTAIVSGGFSGKGVGTTIFSGNVLPLSYSDFIFAAINEELGLIGGISIIIIYILIFLSGIRIVKRQKDNFCFLISFFIIALIVIQAILNIFVSIGLLPPTGLTLPFVSYGGSSNLIFIIMIWILLKVNYFSNEELIEIKEKDNYEI